MDNSASTLTQKHHPSPVAAQAVKDNNFKNDIPWIPRALWAIIIVSMLIHFISMIIGNTLLDEWRWPHYPLHAAVETLGSLIALWVARMLLMLEKRGAGTSYNVWIAGALIGMGILDGFHAIAHESQSFVLLHSAATFAGGLLFVLVWLPKTWSCRVVAWWPWAVITLVTTFTLFAFAFPEAMPQMLTEDAQGKKVFSLWARGLNIIGGILLFAAAARLVINYIKQHNVDDLLFCLHSTLFGAAAIMFEQSELWDVSWWGWHLLRILAYGVALWFIILTEMREQSRLVVLSSDLQQLNQTLEERIEKMVHELRENNANLERSNIELQQFAYIASHDLQSPLRNIYGFTQLLQEDYRGKLDKKADDRFDRIINNAKRMQSLIDDLLTFSRVDSSSRPLGKVKMQEIFNDTRDMLMQSIIDSKAEVSCGTLPTVIGDRSQMVHLLQNLIGNAIKYHSDQPPKIHFSAIKKGEEWIFSVSDNGIGIAPQYHQQIFEIFRRLHTQREYPGTGIGLAVCRRIVERHNGRIWIESESGKGATFYFTATEMSEADT